MDPLTVEPELLEGRELRLEPLEETHRDGLAKAASDPAIWRYLSLDLSTDAGLAVWFDRAEDGRRAGRELPFAIRETAGGTLLGSTRYMAIEPTHRRLEIGWTWLTPAVWGSAVNVASKLLLLEHAFEVMRAHRVEFRTDVLNVRSRAAIEALGAAFEGVFRRHMVMTRDRVRDTVQYAITDEDWPLLKSGLEDRWTARKR